MFDDDTQRVLWQAPTEYDPLKHGPSYLPGVPYEPIKLSSEQKGRVHSLIKTAAFYDVQPAFSQTPMVSMLGLLHALALLHKTHHWSTKGLAYYADHLLFDRLYTESLESIDQLAERIVGSGDAPVIPALQQVTLMQGFLQFLGLASTPEEMLSSSLKGEVSCLAWLAKLLQTLEEAGTLTPGTSNLLEGIADKHETFVYLLQQRLREGGGNYSYNR